MNPILIIDDDEGVRDFVSSILSDEGYAVLTAADGAGALELLERFQPQLILLDLRMPHMDGAEFLQAYRKRSGADAAVVLITAARDAAGSAHRVEADGYLAKPFELQELLDLVARYMPAAFPQPRQQHDGAASGPA